MKIADNRLLLGSVIALGLYWVLGFSLPWTVFSPAINLGLVIASGLLFLRFAPDAVAILFQGVRSDQHPEGDGSHLAVYGTMLVALGGVLAALAGFLLAWPAARGYVQGGPGELFGRGMAAAGLAMIFISPSVSKRGISLGGGLWVYAVAALTIAAVYGLGWSNGFNSDHEPFMIEDTSHIPADRPMCHATERDVWGSASGVYHTPDSVHRRQVIPVRCFTSVEEAEEAGFRAPG